MANIRELLNNPRYHQVREIMVIAGELSLKEDVTAYAVGGCVRDLLLGSSIKDVDLMIEGEGISFARKLAKILGVKKIVQFEKFGTALIPHKPMQIEVTTSRIEKYDANSRNPSEINYTDLNGDLKRRDFTINAMAMDISSATFGELSDPFGGIVDLNAGILKTPLDPDETFSNDPLRMMRAAYFASKLNFKIEVKCRRSMKKQASRIDIVSWERIRDEFTKIMTTKKPSVGLIILQKAGLMKIVFPEIHVMYGLEQTSEWHHKDIFAHTLQVVDNSAQLSNKMELRFAALVHDIAKPNTRSVDSEKGYTFHGHDAIGEQMLNVVAKRMKLPNKLADYIKKLTLLHLRPIALVKSEVTDSAVRRLMVAAGDDLDDLMDLCRADITTKNPSRVKRYLNNFKIVEEKITNVMGKDAMKNFQSPVRGQEIMDICGLSEGRKVGKIKEAIEEAILDGKIEYTYDAAKQYLLKIKNNY
ncbi:MAG: HD domain-containing protein [Candidatus Neomarinimicrobiota bacterium]|jgi:tRNA nucleotidyltransferase/poly(A) polymerase|uniref:HD domain-containing protein n=1 Tax=marine metagenome TaxID=408172 RepID=A0A381VHM0_9ZZZZ|nr:HD domain-containing protein [Candidatus Neomarinimicrobiota bacterium]